MMPPVTEHPDFRVENDPASACAYSFYFGTESVELPRITRGAGVWLYDSRERAYLDFSSGPIANNLGHADPYIIQAMTRHAQTNCLVWPAHFRMDVQDKFAERLCELAGPPFDRVYPVSGGSEAVEASIKLARQYAVATGNSVRTKLISRFPSYHGSTLGALAVTGDPESTVEFDALIRPSIKVPAPIAGQLGSTADNGIEWRHAVASLEEAILAAGAASVLAHIIEPIGGTAMGALVAPDEYYVAVRAICDKYGILLIYDEVMCGLGRCGHFLMSHRWPEAVPDIVVLGKGLGAGYTPLGAILTSQRIVDPVVQAGGFNHAHTYAANGISCGVGLAVLNRLSELGLVKEAARKGDLLGNWLEKLKERSIAVKSVRGTGLFWAVELTPEISRAVSDIAGTDAISALRKCGLDEGLVLYGRQTAGGLFGEWIMVAPPLIISESELKTGVSLLEKAIDRLVEPLART